MSNTHNKLSAGSATLGRAGLRLLPAAALSIAALLGSVAAQAQSYSPSRSVVPAFTPGTSYIALNAGTADLSRPITAFGLFGGEQQGQAYGVAVGNYFAGTNYGVELGYADFGSVNRYGGSTKIDGITLSVLGRMPVSSNFNLLGKLGTTYGRTDVSTDTANSNMAGTERAFDWSYGIGGELVISPQWGLTLQYAEHFVKYPATGNERISSTTLGARFYY
jgi:OOP family OmpA-OmpF porin